MKLKICSMAARTRKLALLLPLLLCSASFAQTNQLSIATPDPVTVKKGAAAASVKIKATLRPGFHCNTNAITDPYLIPLKFAVVAANGIEGGAVQYPKGKDEKYEFAEKPLNVYTGEFELSAEIKATAAAAKGPGKVTGKLRYQACSDKACFAPKTIEVQIPVQVIE